MLDSQVFNTLGLALDIIGFLILIYFAYPTVMRKDFVATERLGLDGPEVDEIAEFERLNNPNKTEQRLNRRQVLQTSWYIFGAIAIVVGFALQIIALYVP